MKQILIILFILTAFSSQSQTIDEFYKDSEDSTQQKEEQVFVIVEEMPRFKGCEEVDLSEIKACLYGNLHEYIAKKIKYPKKAKKNNISGSVFMYFEVAPSGKVENVRVDKGAHELLDAESMRVIQNLPDFKPGKHKGQPVRVSFRFPLNYKL